MLSHRPMGAWMPRLPMEAVAPKSLLDDRDQLPDRAPEVEEDQVWQKSWVRVESSHRDESWLAKLHCPHIEVVEDSGPVVG